MRRASILQVAALAVALVAIPSGSTVFGETSHATVAIERRTQASEAPPVAELYQSVLSFEPGAWTVLHSHTGGSYNTVIEGQVTLRIGDTDRTFGVGEGWTDEPGVLHVAGNAGAADSGEARLIASMVVERGQPPVVVVDPEDEDSAPPPPDLVAMTRAIAAIPSGTLDVVEQTMDLDAGAQVALPAPLGPRMIGVLDGTVTVEIDGTPHTFEAGDGWSETPGVTYAYTTGETGTRLALTSLVPRDPTVASAAGE
jgi:quercetin dioxygenase-like cupin family protein